MFVLARIVSELSEEELKQGYDELHELGKTGILVQGIVRKVDEEFRREIPTQQFSVTVLERAFLYEIAKRYYNKEE
ncbi:hypothetical protein [Paenibacillus periandrae]|uniref:hypothetical protein n=1 Tax=Paenibacillus periandrae TaxID=1761741 RepID=UPI001F08BF9F|nr:hypothetical protein [Paenibacillus periandrae]